MTYPAFCFGLVIAVNLSACALQPAPTVSADVAAAEVALTTAEQVALLYTSLPRCGTGPTLCSSPSTVDRIKALDAQAYTAVTAAKQNAGLVSAAWSAISAFQLAIPKAGG